MKTYSKIFICKECGGILEASHDGYEPLKESELFCECQFDIIYNQFTVSPKVVNYEFFSTKSYYIVMERTKLVEILYL